MHHIPRLATFTTAASTTSAKTAASSTTSIRSSVSPVPGTAVNGTAATPAAVASSSTSLTIIQIDGIAIGCALAVIGAGLLIYYYFVRPRRRAKEEAANKASGNFVTVNMINSTRDGEVGMMGSTTVDRMEFRNGVPAARPNAGSDQSARASRQYDVAAAAFDSAREAYDSPSRMPAQPSTFQNDLRVPASSLSNTNDPRRPTVSRAYQQQDPRMQSEPSAGYPARRLVSSETVSTVAGGGGVGRERTFNMRDHKSTVHRLWTLTDPSPTPNHPPMPSNLSPAHAAAIAHRSSTRTANSTHTADAAYASFSEKKRPGSAAASSSSWRSWNTQQVAKALADLGMDLTVVDLFLRNEIDGVVLARMDSAFLANELGIAAAGARARVMMMVEVVRGEYGGDATPSNGSVASSESPLLSPPPYLR
ncbi:hypothetical protein DFJ73DRAFT_565315 [Zopfochytrium polystomum]|nr:hypothetical protein DFJ73DRAFT_565315 [Zopfochytrium polystomum]